MPQSRAERKALEKAGKFEFFSPRDTPSAEHAAARAYAEAVEQGATHEQAEAYAPWPEQQRRRMKDYVEPWIQRRRAQGKPIDALVDSEVCRVNDDGSISDEMSPELKALGFEQVS